jgi:hypothetical protein
LQTLFYGILGYGSETNGVLGNILNTHPMALKHLMPALMHFYIGLCTFLMVSNISHVSEQKWSRLAQVRNSMINSVRPRLLPLYILVEPRLFSRCSVRVSSNRVSPEPDFSFRRNIAYILKAIWNNPTHRQALETEAGCVSVILAIIGSFAHTVQATSTNLSNLSI